MRKQQFIRHVLRDSISFRDSFNSWRIGFTRKRKIGYIFFFISCSLINSFCPDTLEGQLVFNYR